VSVQFKQNEKLIRVSKQATMSVDEKAWDETLSHCGAELEQSAEGAAATSGVPSAEKALENQEEVEVVALSEEPALPTNDTSVTDAGAAAGRGAAAKEESEVFRIQGESDPKCSEATSALVARENSHQTSSHGAATRASASAAGDNNNTDASTRAASAKRSELKAWGVVTLEVQEIAGNVCVVFPSSANFPEFARNQSSELALANAGPVPIVALHPAFSKTKGTGTTSRALENLFRAVATTGSSDLLSGDFLDLTDDRKDHDNSVEIMCLQRLQALLHRVSESEAPSLLFLILLVRIEVAIYLAFRRTVDEKKGKSKGNAKKPATLADNNLPDEMMKEGRLDVDKLVALVDQLENITNLTHNVVDKSKLNNIIAPLMEGGHCSMDGSHKGKAPNSKLQNILVTPLPALIGLLASAETSSRPTLKAWDSAWTNSLRRLMEFSKTFEKTSNANNKAIPATPQSTHSQDDDWMDTNGGTPPSAQTNTANAKKKKKKNKRKVGTPFRIIWC
jgi:hypothetical protein